MIMIILYDELIVADTYFDYFTVFTIMASFCDYEFKIFYAES